VEATALFDALGWATDRPGDCASALLRLFDRLETEAKNPGVFDVLRGLTTSVMLSTVTRASTPPVIATYDIEQLSIVNLRMPDWATLDAPRKDSIKLKLAPVELRDCLDATLQPEPLTDFKFGTSSPHPASRKQHISKLA
jgi:hypothetical protein